MSEQEKIYHIGDVVYPIDEDELVDIFLEYKHNPPAFCGIVVDVNKHNPQYRSYALKFIDRETREEIPIPCKTAWYSECELSDSYYRFKVNYLRAKLSICERIGTVICPENCTGCGYYNKKDNECMPK